MSCAKAAPPTKDNFQQPEPATNDRASPPRNQEKDMERAIVGEWEQDKNSSSVVHAKDSSGVTICFDAKRGFFYDQSARYYRLVKVPRNRIVEVDSKGNIKKDGQGN